MNRTFKYENVKTQNSRNVREKRAIGEPTLKLVPLVSFNSNIIHLLCKRAHIPCNVITPALEEKKKHGVKCRSYGMTQHFRMSPKWSTRWRMRIRYVNKAFLTTRFSAKNENVWLRWRHYDASEDDACALNTRLKGFHQVLRVSTSSHGDHIWCPTLILSEKNHFLIHPKTYAFVGKMYGCRQSYHRAKAKAFFAANGNRKWKGYTSGEPSRWVSLPVVLSSSYKSLTSDWTQCTTPGLSHTMSPGLWTNR